MANTELASRVGISEAPCFRRVRKLETDGLITGYFARCDQRKLGFSVTAFVLISVDQHDENARRNFLNRVRDEDHVIECHAMTGAYDYLLKVVARDMDHFSELSMDGILRWSGVKSIESQFSLKPIKLNALLPI